MAIMQNNHQSKEVSMKQVPFVLWTSAWREEKTSEEKENETVPGRGIDGQTHRETVDSKNCRSRGFHDAGGVCSRGVPGKIGEKGGNQ